MAKKREVNYFTQINCDEDLVQFLERRALIVLDVFQDLYGPCSLSLHGTLENIKLSLLDSDKLQLAVADAGKCDLLKRFRFKCQPTMIFCDEGKIVDILYGANIPLLVKTIRDQLSAREGNVQRIFYAFDEPLPFEQVELDIIRAQKEEESRLVKEKFEADLYEKLDKVIDLMKENSVEAGVTLFMPHVAEFALKKTYEAARTLLLNSRARKTVQITWKKLAILNYKLENPINDDVLKYLIGKDILAVLWLGDPRKPIANVLTQFVKNVSEPVTVEMAPDENEFNTEEVFPRILDPFIFFLDDHHEQNDEKTNGLETHSNKSRESQRSESAEKSRISKDSEQSSAKQSANIVLGKSIVEIPPVYTPANQNGNFMFMFTFFRSQFDSFLPPDEEPEPPHVCMIFSTKNRSEIFKVAEDFKNDLLAFGFFTSGELHDCKLICKTEAKYDESPTEETDRIIVKVSKRTSRLELALSPLNPLYVSHNTKKGSEDCSLVFNEAFEAAKDVFNKKLNL